MLLASMAVNASEKATLVVIDKADRIMRVMNGDTVLASYHVSLGGNPIGHKEREGDQRTPEGRYVLDYKKSNSAFYKSIHISYPNLEDKERAEKFGVSPGGFIMIHGQKNGLGWLSGLTQMADWTNGCIAVTNEEMDEVWEYVNEGTPVQINP